MHAERVHVIGRGFVGLSVAYELSNLGLPVTVVGPSNMPGSASHAAIGISSVKGQYRAEKPLFAAKLKGHEKLDSWLNQLAKDAGVSVPKDVRGVLEPFWDMTGYDGIHERVFHKQLTPDHRVEVLEAKGLAEKFPSTFLTGALGAFHYYADLWFDPRYAMRALEKVLRDRGTMFDAREVESIVPHPDRGVGLRYRAEAPGNDGIVPISKVILAAGLFSRDILRNSGLSHLHLEAVPGDTLECATDEPDVLLRQGKVNVVVAAKHLWIGSTSYREAQAPVDPAELLTPFSAFLSSTAADMRRISGVRARFKDRCPAIGPISLPGGDRHIWAALGFYKNGLQLGPLFAQKLATMVATSTLFSPESTFSTTRF